MEASSRYFDEQLLRKKMLIKNAQKISLFHK